VHEAAEREDRQQAQTKPPQSSALAPVDQDSFAVLANPCPPLFGFYRQALQRTYTKVP
jgi:hypothetical protein